MQAYETVPETKDCATEAGGVLLPVDPWRSLRVHFGMLLGIDDFETLGAYHRGKTWLHNAWLHREGVVWGLGVEVDQERGEIRVLPGLAIDRLGRELHLDRDLCVTVSRWLEEHEREVNLERLEDGGVSFDAHVVIQFKSCLTRQVPALVEPCEGMGGTTAYSRVFETVELFLRPGLAPDPDPKPYHRLRVLFAIEEPNLPRDQEIVNRRTEILALDPMDRPKAWLEAFRDYAALDEIDLRPAVTGEDEEATLFPAVHPAPLVLANIQGITLDADRRKLTGGEKDVTVRPVLVATSTIQELLCGPPCPGGGEEELPPGEEMLRSLAGPRIDSASVAYEKGAITFAVRGDLLPETLKPAVHVNALDDSGWVPVRIGKVLQNRGKVTVRLTGSPKGPLLRLIVRGTGEAPVLGTNLVPLAGALGGPPGTRHDGHDFVHMIPLTTERS